MIDKLKLQNEILEHLGRTFYEVALKPGSWHWHEVRRCREISAVKIDLPSLYQKFKHISAVDFIVTLKAMIAVGLLEGDVKKVVYYAAFELPALPASLSPDGPRPFPPPRSLVKEHEHVG